MRPLAEKDEIFRGIPIKISYERTQRSKLEIRDERRIREPSSYSLKIEGVKIEDGILIGELDHGECVGGAKNLESRVGNRFETFARRMKGAGCGGQPRAFYETRF